MQRPGIVRAAAAAALLTLLGAGCTPAPAPQPTPTPATASPPETAQEREQRLAYAAAEKSYREFRAEYHRILGRGGARQASAVMRATAGDGYLTAFTQILQANKDLGIKQVGTVKIGYVRPAGYSPTSVLLDVCEDTRDVREIRTDGKVPQPGEVRTARLDVRLVSGSWKVWTGQGQKADSCD